MIKRSLLSRLKRLLYPAKQDVKGFTLIELLIVTIIAGGIISGLMYIVVELTGLDQRESSLTETQREMQLALDYISTELREAVFVYTGECLAGQGDCSGLINYLPPQLSAGGNIPVIAFWKHQPIPAPIRTICAGNNPRDAAGNVPPCLAASSYALVVYSLNTQADPTWNGRARITRYILKQYQDDGTPVTGYVNPATFGNFDTWPLRTVNGTQVNQQGARPTAAAGNPAVLVDFVDNGAGAAATATNFNSACPDDVNTTGPDYSLSPNAATVRSFYACVSTGLALGENRDVILFLRGNAYGRPGIFTDARFLPTLETRVLSRGVLGKNPGTSTGSNNGGTGGG